MNESESFGATYEAAWQKLKKENPRPVILVTGGTGAGKSTLINLVLNKDEAEVGQGTPVTQHMERFQNDMVVIWDSKGYESGEKAQIEFFEEIKAFLDKEQSDPGTAINIVWHCISAPGARILDVDKKLLFLFKERQIPAAVVFTQVDCVGEEDIKALTGVVKDSDSPIPVFLSTTDKELLAELPDNTDKLYEWSLKNMDRTRRAAFRAACNRGLDQKRYDGHKISIQHAAAAFGIGFSPIPVSDAPLMIASQMGMLARLSYVWGLDLKTYLGTGGILEIALANLGKAIAGNALKLIPGIGTILGGMINGTIGAALTYGLGGALNEICYAFSRMKLEGKTIPFGDFLSRFDIDEMIKETASQWAKVKKEEGM